MIEDPHERTRAILWMLADLDPNMPLLEALGQLKAVEATLELKEPWEDDSEDLKRFAALWSSAPGSPGTPPF